MTARANLRVVAAALTLLLTVAVETYVDAGADATSFGAAPVSLSDGTEMVSVHFHLGGEGDGQLLVAVQGLVHGSSYLISVQVSHLPTSALEVSEVRRLTAVRERGDMDVAFPLPPHLMGPCRLNIEVYDEPVGGGRVLHPDAILARVTRNRFQIPGRPSTEGDAVLHRDIARFVQSMLDSWADVEVEKLHVQETSGAGGHKTFKVAYGSEAVFFSSRDSRTLHENEKRLLARLRKASRILAAQKLAPARLAEGETWFITEWLQRGSLDRQSGALELETAAALGSLLSRLHSIDTTWFDEFKRHDLQRYPELTNADGSTDSSADGLYSWCAAQADPQNPSLTMPHVRIHIPYTHPGFQVSSSCPPGLPFLRRSHASSCMRQVHKITPPTHTQSQPP
jgi:hypothetical protein